MALIIRKEEPVGGCSKINKHIKLKEASRIGKKLAMDIYSLLFFRCYGLDSTSPKYPDGSFTA